MASGERREMDREECRQALLTRVQRLNPRDAEDIVHHTFDILALEEIRTYVKATDARIHVLIGKMEKTMLPRDPSPGPELPPPFWTSQGRSSVEGIQAPPTDQIGTAQLPGSSRVPDDGMRGFPDPSLDSQSQGQSSSTSVGVQSAHAGQIVTSQFPGSSSVPDDGMREFPWCSNITGCDQSSSRQWPDICHFYISRRGLCKKGLSCDFSHGFGSSGKFEMEIRKLLLIMPYNEVSVADLSWIYFDLYRKYLPLRPVWLGDPFALRSLLWPLHTVCLIPDSYGQHLLVLVEHSQAYLGYSDNLRDWELLGPNKIYISFSAASRSICTENVYGYFRQYGPVMSVTIPYQRSFGFVRFQYPETVRLLLSEWNPRIPHFISGVAVHVCPYIPKGEAKLKNSAGKHELQNWRDLGIITEKSSGTSSPEIALPLTHDQPSHSQMAIGPLEGGDVAGSPDKDSADHSQPSHSQVEIDQPEVLLGGQVPGGLVINQVEAGQVLGGLVGDPADEQIADEAIPGLRLPDAHCFYKQT